MKTFVELRDKLGWFEKVELLYSKEISKKEKEFCQKFTRGEKYFTITYREKGGTPSIVCVDYSL